MATTTFFPDAGSGGAVRVDGRTNRSETATWTSTVTNANASSVSTTEATADLRGRRVAGTNAISRLHFVFDTSSIPNGDTINSAVISFAGSGDATTDADATNIVVTSCVLVNNNNIVLADYNDGGTTEFVTTRMTLATWVTTAGTYNDMTLNASGLTNISKTADSLFMVRIGRDFDDVAPTGDNLLFMRLADTAGTASDPRLVVVHSDATANSGFFAFF